MFPRKLTKKLIEINYFSLNISRLVKTKFACFFGYFVLIKSVGFQRYIYFKIHRSLNLILHAFYFVAAQGDTEDGEQHEQVPFLKFKSRKKYERMLDSFSLVHSLVLLSNQNS